MAKLMEVIEKSPNFKKGTVSMKLLDTTFSQLTRKIGSQAGVNYKTVRAGQMLSKELLQSLNRDQLTLKEKLLKWQQAYNTYIDSIKSIITDATHFDYTFTSLVDYTSKYIVNKTLADYYLLTEFVNAEKELYEFGHYWGRNHMINLLSQMKEWSKTRWYGSCVGEVGVEYETYMRSSWAVTESAGFSIRNDLEGHSKHDKCYIFVTGLQSMSIGETRLIKIEAVSEYNDVTSYGYLEITRNSLNTDLNDDGYFSFRAWEEGMDKVRSAPRVTQWSGVGSPHFDISKPTLQLIKKVNLSVRTN